MKWKKPFFRLIGIVAVLVICNYIGQNFVKPAKEKENYGEENLENIIEKENISIEKLEWRYEGEESVEDNPWGYSIGMITMKDENRALFMTPETMAIFSSGREKRMCSAVFQVRIHPWVHSKDGAKLTVYIEEKNTKKILEEKSYQINEQEEIIEINLEKYQDREVEVKIYCNAGESGNREGDWIVLVLSESF